MNSRGFLFAFLSVVSALLLAACATPRTVETDDEPSTLPVPAEFRLADFEDFDVAPYRETVPDLQTFEHDVPQSLMEGSFSSGEARVVQGYRVQILSSVEKSEALEIEEEAKRWWRQEGRRGVMPEELPVYVVYRQPYYRVRIGNFTSRDDAQRALSAFESRFPGSFIVPDQVTIYE
ncbi:MAG: SPOR domain-containing protein [Rhodothermales bacterium]